VRTIDAVRFAERIDDAHLAGTLLDAGDAPSLDLADAYRTQSELTARRLSRGARRIGWKLGYTSAAMRAQMGVDHPNLGPLLDTMLLTGRPAFERPLVQPKVEPEIALVIGADGRVAEVRAALEIVDSVWRDYRFTLELNTADGSSAAGVVLGPALAAKGLAELPVRLLHNDTVAAEATAAAAMGDPFAALDWLTAELAGRDEHLREGDVVLTGGLTRAVTLGPTDEVAAVFGTSTGTEVTISGRATR
jgi:2-keto-4-pentenoate hydratase